MFQVELIPWADTFPDFWVAFSVLLAVLSVFTPEFDNGIIWDHFPGLNFGRFSESLCFSTTYLGCFGIIWGFLLTWTTWTWWIASCCSQVWRSQLECSLCHVSHRFWQNLVGKLRTQLVSCLALALVAGSDLFCPTGSKHVKTLLYSKVGSVKLQFFRLWPQSRKLATRVWNCLN